MFEKFLLTNFGSRKDEYIQSITKLKAELGNVIQSIKDLNTKPDDELLRQKLDWALKRFPFEELEDLKRSSYVRGQELFKSSVMELSTHFDQLSELLNSKQSVKEFDADPFLKIESKFSLLAGRVRNHFSRIKMGIQSLFLVPLVLTAGINLYYKLGKGFQSLSESIIKPADVYGTMDKQDVFRFSENYDMEYWEELSSGFFLMSNDFNSRFTPKEDLFTKFVIRSKEATRSDLIYNITMNVDFEEKPFEWNRLDVEPIPDLYDDGRSIIIDNQIGAPLIDLNYRIEDQNEDEILNQTHGNLLFSWKIINLTELKGDDYSLYYENRNSNEYIQYYYKLNGDPDAPDDWVRSFDTIFGPEDIEILEPQIHDNLGREKFFRFKQDWYEIIYNSDDMSKHFELQRIDTIKCFVNYKDLKKQLYSDTIQVVTNKPIVYYKRSPQLVSERPRYFDLDADFDNVLNLLDRNLSAMDGFIALAEDFVGRPPYVKDPKGVNMMIDTFTIKLDEWEKGSSTKNLDAVLNPLGYIIAYGKILGADKNGIYKVNLSVNDKKRTGLCFEQRNPQLEIPSESELAIIKANYQTYYPELEKQFDIIEFAPIKTRYYRERANILKETFGYDF